MSDDAEQKLEQVRELEDIVGRLKDARGDVRGFDVNTYEEAGGGEWAGQRRDQFTNQFDTAKSSYDKISDQIGQAISDVKSKQRSLAYSINMIEHPIISAQAIALAL